MLSYYILNIYFTFRMTNLGKLKNIALNVSRNNYLSWIVDAELQFNANRLKDTTESGQIPNVEQNV